MLQNRRHGTLQDFCLCFGACDLFLRKEEDLEKVSLNDSDMTIEVEKEILVEIKNYNNDTKIVIDYFRDKEQ